jgi:TolB protein
MIRWIARMTLLVVLGGLLLVSAAVGVGHAAASGGLIAYVEYRGVSGGLYDIFLLDTTRGASVNLTRSARYDDDPAWSPDATSIVFVSAVKALSSLVLYPLNGGTLHEVGDIKLGVYMPSWSPDGEKIALILYYPGADFQVAVLDRASDSVRSVTRFPTDPERVVWSPDSRSFLIAGYGGGSGDIYRVDAETYAMTRLTPGAQWNADPAWSPDGQTIAFSSDRNGSVDIYVMNSLGGSVVRLTREKGMESTPHWSPDGQHLVFAGVNNGDSEIYVMDADGENVQNVSRHPNRDFDPEWSPDGQHIFFLSDRDGLVSLYRADADGTHVERLILNRLDGSVMDFSVQPLSR